MNYNVNKLRKIEERMQRVVRDPEKIIKLICKIINLSCYDGPLPVPENLRVTYYEFVDMANFVINSEEESKGNTQDLKDLYSEMEKDIREINGFSDETLPGDMEFSYK